MIHEKNPVPPRATTGTRKTHHKHGLSSVFSILRLCDHASAASPPTAGNGDLYMTRRRGKGGTSSSGKRVARKCFLTCYAKEKHTHGIAARLLDYASCVLLGSVRYPVDEKTVLLWHSIEKSRPLHPSNFVLNEEQPCRQNGETSESSEIAVFYITSVKRKSPFPRRASQGSIQLRCEDVPTDCFPVGPIDTFINHRSNNTRRLAPKLQSAHRVVCLSQEPPCAVHPLRRSRPTAGQSQKGRSCRKGPPSPLSFIPPSPDQLTSAKPISRKTCTPSSKWARSASPPPPARAAA